jgi:hypothetical protein
MYSDTAISKESDLIARFELCFSRSLRQICIIFVMSAGPSLSSVSGRNSSRVASMSGASDGSEGRSESLVISGVDHSAFSEIAEII